MKTLKEVALETGQPYTTLLYYVRKYWRDLNKEGVLVVRETIGGRRKYYVPDTDSFVNELKKLVRRK
jgi:hypothetical protein